MTPICRATPSPSFSDEQTRVSNVLKPVGLVK